MDKTKFYLNLSECKEEERKSLPQILEKAGQEIYFLAKPTLLSGELDMFYPYLVFSRPSSNVWVFSHNKPDRTEITYPEFIKLFEGGEEETEVQKLKKQIDLYKECFELFIRIEKWDEANEFLSINGNPLAKHLSRVQKEVEKKPKF